MPGATVKAFGKDSAFITGAVSDAKGFYSLKLPSNAKVRLVFSSPFYNGKGRWVKIETKSDNIELDKITLEEVATNLEEVKVVGVQTRGEQRGDTTSFNSAAFKTNPDATAEDLVKKMPGITSDNNGIKVNGETVQKILVDGKPFFGDDAAATLKNLPAEIIEKVQVFDKMSDQAQFSGFNDGDSQKTINLITKREKNAGYFGRIYSGLGADQDQKVRYNSGASINSFNNKRRLTLLLLSNNVNQQNFSTSDITGAIGSSGQGGRGRQSGADNLMASPQNGNNITNSGGLNYNDSWGSKVTVSGSYFYNYTDNRNVSSSSRNYFTGNNLTYSQANNSRSQNQNHRLNARLEYGIDSLNKVVYTPSFGMQDNRAGSALSGTNAIAALLLSKTETNSKNNNIGYDFSNNLLYQHKFRQEGRTVSLNLSATLSERDNNGNYYSANVFADTVATGLDQLFRTYGYTKRISANLSYTEPLHKNGQLQFSYVPSYTKGKSNKKTEDYDELSKEYTSFNQALSNKYDNINRTQKAGLSYRYNKDKLNLTLGADAQESVLNGNQVFPYEFNVKQSFYNILPNAMFSYKQSKSKNLRINYRTSTNIPTLTQLQDVVDISNPLQVKTGNSALKQTFDNNVSLRYGGFNNKTSRNAMVFINGSATNNYISNGNFVLKSDSVIQGYAIKAGSQLTKPVNLNGYYSARAFFVFGFPVSKLKSNLSFNGGLNFTRTPGIINYYFNKSNNYAGSAGIYLGSNISDNFDFSLAYNGAYTIVENSILKQSDNSYFSHTATFKLNAIVFKGLVINTDVTNTLYSGLSQNYSQQYFLWNAYVGYKFLKNRSLELKLGMFDILNENRSIGRTVSAAYTEDYYTTVLRRYFMFTLTYTLRNFKGQETKTEDRPPLFPGGPPPGMRPNGGNN